MQNLTADPRFSRSRFGRLTNGSSALARPEQSRAPGARASVIRRDGTAGRYG